MSSSRYRPLLGIVGFAALSALCTLLISPEPAEASDRRRHNGWHSTYYDNYRGDRRRDNRRYHNNRRPPRQNYRNPRPQPRPRLGNQTSYGAVLPSCPSGTRYDGRSCIIIDQRLRKPGGDGRINPCPKGMWNSGGTCVPDGR